MYAILRLKIEIDNKFKVLNKTDSYKSHNYIQNNVVKTSRNKTQ